MRSRMLSTTSQRAARRERRSGYTLLEVLLASAIGVLLMGGLYVAVDVQLRHAQAARELIEQGTLVRALMARVASDVNASVGPTQPVVSSGSSAGGAGAGAAGGGSGGSTAAGSSAATASGSGGGGGAGASATSGSGGAASSSTSANAVQINYFQGDSSNLVVTVSKWPRELNLSPNVASELQPVGVSDLRRITYWLVNGGGLARQEVKVVTSSDASLTPSLPPNVGSDEASYVIADEVKSLNFQYWDGTAWQDNWDSTQVSTVDNVTPQGPPLAIAITMEIAVSGAGAGRDSQPKTKVYRQVVPIVTANGATQASTNGTTISP